MMEKVGIEIEEKEEKKVQEKKSEARCNHPSYDVIWEEVSGEKVRFCKACNKYLR